MVNYEKIADLLRLYGQFEEEHSDSDFSAFGKWLAHTQHQESGKKGKRVLPKANKETNDSLVLHQLKHMHQHQPPNVQIAILVGRLNKFSRMYMKKALGEDLALTPDEFQFLASAAFMEQARKSDLIAINVVELTTGVEILKRMEKMKYIRQVQSKEDKRTKLILLTGKGRKTLLQAFSNIQDLASLLTARLHDSAVKQLLETLEYLNDFHASIYVHDKEESIEGIVRKRLRT
ncbi:MAG: MarR family winged helix-turn-helix transcriptional regulator [Cytophagaceae bacterium]|jgi:DNA-binding MarR family transcriptional regulator|nr:MarR family winged helix-turn-helix transcriptional regulator [Cytophagaceae bacterium]